MLFFWKRLENGICVIVQLNQIKYHSEIDVITLPPSTQHKSVEGVEGFDYKWLAYSKNKMSMFLFQNGYLNGLKEN